MTSVVPDRPHNKPPPRAYAVEWHFVAMRQCSRQQRLTASVTPRLGDDASRHLHRGGVVSGNPKHRPRATVIVIQSDQRAGVENERRHAPTRARAAVSGSLRVA